MQYSDIVQRVLELAQQASETRDRAARQSIEQDLQAFLKPLKAAEIYMLVTLMYLGLEGGSVAGLMDRYQQMSDTFGTPERAINQLFTKHSLHKHLKNSLDILATAGVEVDTLLTTYIDSPLALLNSSDDVELSLGPWCCDQCGRMIAKPEHGLLQWLASSKDGQPAGRDLRIVHVNHASPLGLPDGCGPNPSVEFAKDGSALSDVPLHWMLEPDGLVRLLAFVDEGEFPANEVNQIIMRLFVPGYEKARPYFQKAIDAGIVDADRDNVYFYQSQLGDIVANIPKLEK
jgi:hypothetical protein